MEIPSGLAGSRGTLQSLSCSCVFAILYSIPLYISIFSTTVTHAGEVRQHTVQSLNIEVRMFIGREKVHH